MDTKEINKALDRAFEQGTKIVNGDVDLLQSLRDALIEVDRLREALEHSYHCGLAISHGMGCPVAEALGSKAGQ